MNPRYDRSMIAFQRIIGNNEIISSNASIV